MEHRRVDPLAGWRWLGRGWSLFRRSPARWVAITAVLTGLNLLLSLMPAFGPLLALLFAPALFGGLVHAARRVEDGARLDMDCLFRALGSFPRAGGLLLLGIVPLAAAVGIALAAGGLLGPGDGMPGPAIGPLDAAGLAFFVIAITAIFAALALLLFAIPLLIRDEATPVRALRASLAAVHANVGAFLVLSTTWLLLVLLALVPFGLGFLILLPVSAGAVHAAHAQVFGAGGAGNTSG